MADVDWISFAYAVAAKVDAKGYTSRSVPGVKTATVSRARNAIPVSPGNYLALCKALDIGPFEHFRDELKPRGAGYGAPHEARKSQRDQYVSVGVTRETGGGW